MSSAARRGLAGISIVVLIALAIVFGRGLDWRAAWSAMRGANAGILTAALAANLLSLCLKGTRWWVLLEPEIGRAHV